MISQPVIVPEQGPKVYSVSELTRDIKVLLETKYPVVWVEGEVSNFRVSPTGHAYFTLKDAFSQVAGVVFRSQLCQLSVDLKDGMKGLRLNYQSECFPKEMLRATEWNAQRHLESSIL